MMKYVVSTMLVILAMVTTPSMAQQPPPYETPTGWQMQEGANGLKLFAPLDGPKEGVGILLFPVIPVQGDASSGFDNFVQRVIENKKIVQQSELTVEARGPYRDYLRTLVLQDASGTKTVWVCALSTLEGKGQLAVFAAGSEEAYKKYISAAVAFQQKWNFAQRELKAATRIDFEQVKKVMLGITACLLLQEQTKYQDALNGWRELEALLATMARFPQAKPGTQEAFWESQMISYDRQVQGNILNCTLYMGRFEEAIKLAQASIARAKQNNDQLVLAASYASLGSAQYNLLEYDGARASLHEARTIIDSRFEEVAKNVEKIVAKPPKDVNDADYKFVNDAFTLFTEARIQYSRIFSLFMTLGLFEEAIQVWDNPHFAQLERITHSAGFRRVLEGSMAGLGSDLPKEVMKKYDAVLPMETLEHVSCLLTAWRAKASDSGSAADWEQAKKYLEEYRKLVAARPDDAFQQASLHANVGAFAIGQKNWAEAAKELEIALEISKKIPLAGYRDALRQIVLIRYAEVAAEIGKPDAGLKALAEAQTLPVAVDNNLQSLYFHALGKAAAAAQKNDVALAAYYRCLEFLEKERAGVKDPEILKKFFRRRQAIYEDIIHFLQKSNQPKAALEVMELGRSRALADLLSRTVIKKGQTPDVAGKLAAIRERERQRIIAENRKRAGGPSTISASTAATEEHGMDELLAARPELAEIELGRTPSPPKDLGPLIDDSTVILEYFFGDRYSAVVAGDMKSGSIHDLKLNREEIQALVGELRSAIQSGAADEWQPAADRLYAALLAPVQKEMAGKTRVVIVPHGVTNYLPWSVLGPKGGKVLAEDHDVVVLPSVITLALCRMKARHQLKNGMAFAIGNVPNTSMAPLPGTREEVASIAIVMPGMKVELEKDFNFTNVANKARDAGVLHFATHGIVNAKDPDRSGIVTAEGNLYLKDIINLDLHADLVVLSACSTGLGKIYGGDEMVGLTRSFMYAGTPSIVATLWKVSDKATARFMVLYYEALKAGKDKAAALRSAQMALRKDFPQPVYWAPFTLYGDWK